jgi:hypothetical protein
VAKLTALPFSHSCAVFFTSAKRATMRGRERGCFIVRESRMRLSSGPSAYPRLDSSRQGSAYSSPPAAHSHTRTRMPCTYPSNSSLSLSLSLSLSVSTTSNTQARRIDPPLRHCVPFCPRSPCAKYYGGCLSLPRSTHVSQPFYTLRLPIRLLIFRHSLVVPFNPRYVNPFERRVELSLRNPSSLSSPFTKKEAKEQALRSAGFV